ncbi:hypothetical protein [Ruegeria profundi]|uniref:hypothetical protein n=1 Tax=Ruegeria profundi TaxID=1685378 RepID=UPI001CD1B617|nr:hypothetical protein [Ruegeria profundi]MCA0927937.1 hypothetical protein [Ruegeria profundi]
MTTQISAPGATDVALERQGPLPKGYYSLDLRRSNFRLNAGIIYVWKVMLIESDQVVATAESLVERVELTADDPGQTGIWFDALAPLVSIDLNGRARIADDHALTQLLKAGELAGVDQFTAFNERLLHDDGQTYIRIYTPN